MLRHHHITEHHEAMLLPHLFENFQEQITLPMRSEPRLSLIATAGDIVQFAGSAISPQTFWHLAILRAIVGRRCDG